jgi:hypothetical protein
VEYNVLDNGWIQDNFELTHDVYGVYRGAIVMPSEEYNALTPEQLSAMKQQRVDSWAAYITEASTQSVPVEDIV